MNNLTKIEKDWWKESAVGVPRLVIEAPGPLSKIMHANTTRYMKGLSSQVKLFPVCFEEGYGITLTDIDGNKYLDFSSGIYVTSLGHCHPKISEAISYWARKLMNCHDFTTPVKEKLMDLNTNPKGNNLIPYDNMVINKVRFLNHRWIIADFTGESGWGEIIIKYFIEKDDTVTFEAAETVLYPSN